MFKKSKFALVAVAALLLAGCGGGGGGELPKNATIEDALTVKVAGVDIKSTIHKDFKPGAKRESYRLTVWSEVEAHPLFTEVLTQFVKDYAYDEKNNTLYEFNIRIGDEFSAAATAILADVSLAPNVFGFPDDQTEQLVAGGVLAELTGDNLEWAKEQNVDTSIESATYEGKVYAYPQTADNGYFLYYNSEYLSLKDVESFDNILARLKAHTAERTDGLKSSIVFPFEDSWYIPSFFFHNHSDDVTAEPAFSYDTASKTMKTTIRDEAGQNSARGMDRILSEENQAYIKAIDVNDAAEMFSNVDANSKPRIPEALLGVTGTWNSATLKAAMGDGYAATKLPTFTPVAADGTELPQQQMGSFAGSKLIGVLKSDDSMKSFFSHEIAQLLTNKQTQVRRFQTQGFGPSNVEAQKDPAVVADVAIAALGLQSQFAVSQSRSVDGSFWDPTATFGKKVVSQDYGEEGKTVVDFLEDWANAIAPVAVEE